MEVRPISFCVRMRCSVVVISLTPYSLRPLCSVLVSLAVCDFWAHVAMCLLCDCDVTLPYLFDFAPGSALVLPDPFPSLGSLKTTGCGLRSHPYLL